LRRLGLRFFHLAALIVAAMRARLVRQLRLMAIRAFRTRGLRQMVMRSPRTRPPLRMSSFWIRHRTTPLFAIPSVCIPAGGLKNGLLPLLLPHITRTHKPAQFAAKSDRLLFLEPVLFQPRQGSQARIGAMSFASALFVIQVRSARRTQPAAVTPADCLHWHRQEYLFAQHIGQEQSIPGIKSHVRVVVL